MLPGSGIGPELMNYVKEVFRYKMKNFNCNTT
jgi:isocitrate/isopropylmalate dehydrogenase